MEELPTVEWRMSMRILNELTIALNNSEAILCYELLLCMYFSKCVFCCL